MEKDEDLERWKAWAFAALVFATKGNGGGPDGPNFADDVDAEFFDQEDDGGPPIPVTPKSRPPARNSGVALPEREDVN